MILPFVLQKLLGEYRSVDDGVVVDTTAGHPFYPAHLVDPGITFASAPQLYGTGQNAQTRRQGIDAYLVYPFFE